MSYLKKIEYEIILKESFKVIWSCSKCGRKTCFKNTKKFRINANGNKLDIWLIYQCEECQHTLNLAIYERQKVSSIPKDERSRKLFKAHISALFLFLCFILSSKLWKKNFIKFPKSY